MKVSVIFLCVFLSLHVQAKEPCQPPPLLEGKFTAINTKKTMSIFGSFSSDLPGRRFRLRELIQDNGYTTYVDELLLFSEKVMYVISYATSTCWKSPLNMDVFPMELPANAYFSGQVYLGLSNVPGQRLLVDSWTGTHPYIKGNYSIVTTSTCVPVSSLYYIEPTGTLVTSYYDLVNGIKNMTVFTPPSFCNQEE